ncbi:hypothetical protein ACRQ5Q_16850 [Bradyrhizobium sp. PMVTL-01]|uniref:hypothetical protein n=1 Tax=Bradyrhizobium sp. PMVTL-01 TaxID=3434999 RepID=UPI003F6FA690
MTERWKPENAFELTPFMVKLLRRAWSNGCVPLADDMAFRHAEMAAMREMAKHGFVRSAEMDRAIPGPPQPPGWVITDKGREAAYPLSPPEPQGVQKPLSDPVGTFACDICGYSEPHGHDLKELEIERYARPTFEAAIVKWLDTYVPTERRWRGEMLGIVGWKLKPARNPGQDSPNYTDQWIEALWSLWLGAWVAKQSWHTAFDSSANEPQRSADTAQEVMEKARAYIEYSLDTHGNDIAGNGMAALNALDRALSGAQPRPSAATVQVRPLEWAEGKGELKGQLVWSSGDPWVFWIVKNLNEKYIWCENFNIEGFCPCSPVRGSFDTLDEAKAAAQADYDERIRAAVILNEPQPTPVIKLANKWRTQARQHDEAADECFDRGDDDEGDVNHVEATSLRRCADELAALTGASKP